MVCLSGFLGSPSSEFFGGQQVVRLEADWSDKFNVKHSVSCNSATSGLIMAVGALGIGPGDEVIVSPYTMSATAAAMLFYGGIPIFCVFCMDPQTIESKISSATKAILTTDIHGQSSDMAEILRIARKHNLFVINDCAQAPRARYRGEHVGGIGDVGIFSLISYLKPSYLEPLYQKRNAIGDHGYPFNAKRSSGDLKYEKGLCPVAEQLYEHRSIINPFVYPPLETSDAMAIADVIEKVSGSFKL